MFDSIKEDKSCDILIIGGGMAGLFAAKELLDLEKEVIVAEKSSIGSGRTSVGKDVVFTDGGIALERQEYTDIKKIVKTFSTLTDELEKFAELVYEKSFEKKGLLIFSDSPRNKQDMRRRFMIEKFCKREAELILSDDLLGDFSFDFESAVYTENGGAVINARSLAEKTASYLSVNGALIAENTEITSLVPTENGFSAQTANGAKITAKAVVDARCSTKKRAVFTAKTAPVNSSLGWPQGCIIRDTYKNRMTFYRTATDEIGMTFEKRVIFPSIFGSEHNFSYMQNVLSSMFFAMPNTLFEEKNMIYEERSTVNRSRIRLSSEIPNLYIFDCPYANGLLSALQAAKNFGLTVAKSGK